MTKYTDEDVARLIKTASWVSDEYKDSNSDVRQLYEALAPFRPDPEEVLLIEMRKAFSYSVWPNAKEQHRFDNGVGQNAFPDEILKGMAAVLQVIKEKGYFNDQR